MFIVIRMCLLKKITITWRGNTSAWRQTYRNGKQVKLKTCRPFTDCISEINNTQADNAKDFDADRS